MTERNRNALIGLFVLGGLICLGTLIVKFGESRGLFGKRYVVNAKFERIARVKEGTDVNLAGVWAGSVFKIDLVDRFNPSEGVIVAMEIGKEFSVPRDSVATVITPLMGQAVINIIPPTTPTEPLPQDGSAEPIDGILKNPLETVIDPK
ncbi:MAG: MlaD family protein, partial [Planctomycetota bacterium]